MTPPAPNPLAPAPSSPYRPNASSLSVLTWGLTVNGNNMHMENSTVTIVFGSAPSHVCFLRSVLGSHVPSAGCCWILFRKQTIHFGGDLPRLRDLEHFPPSEDEDDSLTDAVAALFWRLTFLWPCTIFSTAATAAAAAAACTAASMSGVIPHPRPPHVGGFGVCGAALRSGLS